MKTVKVLLTIFAAASLMLSCEPAADKDGVKPAEGQLEVTANNIRGQWQLVKWNGNALVDTYMYLDIERDETYTMYQNMDSFTDVPHVITGEYYLYPEEMVGMVIRGNYDHSNEEWTARYIIKSLTKSSMIWVNKNDQTQIQEFARVDEIPVIE